MKKVYTDANRLLVENCRNILENCGIECVMKNEFLSGALGELPPNECWLEIWVDDRDQTRAEDIIRDIKNTPDNPPWQCPGCNERLEGQFTVCWQCGEERQFQD